MHVCVEVAMKKIFDPVTDSLEDFLNDEVEQNLRAEGELAIADFIRAKLNAQKLFQHQAQVEGWIYAEHAHNDTDKVGQWLEQHCQHKYNRRNNQVLFESSKDATMFVLRWV